MLAEFASAGPTPGGGSAAALTAAVGLSLVAMVARMPRTKHGTDEDRQALDGVLQAVEHLAQHALDLVDDDAAAYDAVVAAYRKPKATEDQKVERRSAIEAALRGAAEVPLEVMRSCRAGLGAALEAAKTGNPSASSDVGVAVELLGAALRSAALNVRREPVEPDRDGLRGRRRRRVQPPRIDRRATCRGSPRRAQCNVTTTTCTVKSHTLG